MRNNMTASMFDLSAAGKSRSRLGKFKDKVRGKKKESDTASNVVPSFTQVLTDSEEEGNQEEDADKGEKKKKPKMKSLFSTKSNLQRNMSQSMSVLPAKNSSLSGSQSSGLNVDSSEGKKKFKFLIHKRSGSSDSKDSSSGHQKHGAAEQSNLCINGSHVYCEGQPPQTSRIGSNFSLASSGHGSMEDVPESSPSVDSLRAVKQYSPWTEEEEEGEHIKEDVGELRREEEERIRRQEKELERLAEEKRQEEEEKEEKVKREELIRRQEEERAQEERRQKKEEERLRREEERKRLAKEKRRLEEQEKEKVRKEEEERIRREERVEEERMREEEERVRRQEHEEKRRLEEQERRRREEEERIRMEEERAQEERRHEEVERARRREEQRKLAEEKRTEEEERIEKVRKEEEERIRREEEMAEEERRRQEKVRIQKECEEKRRLEEQERRRREEEERIKDEEKARREKEDYERLVEKMKLEEEEERKRIEAEEKMRQEERIRVEEEMRKKEEERVRRQEREKSAEKKRIEEQERRRIEEERIRMEDRRQDEEETARKEKEEHERLVEEKNRQEERERRRIEEEKIKKEEEKRIRMEEEAEKERTEEEARKLEMEKLIREAEEQKDNQTKPNALGKEPRVAVESPAGIPSNPSDENFSNNPFEKIPDSPAGLDSNTAKVSTIQQRVQSAASLVGSKPVSTDEKNPISTQRERRLAPQPPGRNQVERQAQGEQHGSMPHLAQINKKSKDIKTVLPQRSVQMIAPLSRSPTDTKNTQSITQSSSTKETSNGAKHSKRPAPSRPRSVEEGPSSDNNTARSSDGDISHECGSGAKQFPIVYGLNPFEDDEDENVAQDDATTSGNTDSVQWPPVVSQAADKDAASQVKIKSSKARAPALPVTIPDNSACDPESEAISPVHVQEAPLHESQPAAVQSAGEEAGGKKEGPPITLRRLQPVKPLNPMKQQSVSVVPGENDNKSTGILCQVQEKKVKDTGLKGPYSQLTREELISLVLKQETQLSERNKKISELEQYIDNLLVRVIEEKPSILMSLNSLKKAA
ncbi:trichohyalin isoform X2 [Perca flavescens]|nr:trichohyalin-like isoform X2 [Perca flavescens]